MEITHFGDTTKTAVVLFDCVFVFLNTATTIAAVMRTLGRNLSGKRARSPPKKRSREILFRKSYAFYSECKTKSGLFS